MDKNLARELLKTRKSVKRKYESLKSDIAESQLALREQFKPISQPLQELLSTIKSEGVAGVKPKVEISPIKKFSSHRITSTPTRITPTRIPSTPAAVKPASSPSFLHSETIGEFEPVVPETVVGSDESLDAEEYEAAYQEAAQEVKQMMEPAVLDKYLDQFKGLAKTYVEDLIRDAKGEFDVQYGVRFNLETDKFHIGNKELHFEGQDIYIMDGNNRVTYKGTPGFYELMFKKAPLGYNAKDMRDYKDIVNRSSAHRKNYDPEGQISGNVGPKYKNVIKRMQTAPKTPRRGKGLLTVNNKQVEFVPWKNPNTLVDRLRILIASQLAGHTGHNNEIVNIIDALKTANVMK